MSKFFYFYRMILAILFVILMSIHPTYGGIFPLATAPSRNTYHPLIDSILLHTQQIPQIIGEKKEFLSLFSFKNGVLAPIPWQLDQVNADGEIYLSNDQKNIPIRIAPRDELLWMVEDMGEKAPSEVLFRYANFDAKNSLWLEIEIEERNDKGRWIYLFLSRTGTQTQLVKQYITYRASEDLIITPCYYLGYRDVIIADRLGWIKPDQTFGPNQLNRVAVRFQARSFFGLIPINVTEENLESEVIGFKEGPIRAIKRIKSAPQLPFGLTGPSNVTNTYFYRNYFKTAVKIKFPTGAKVLIQKASFKIYVDLTPKNQKILLTLPNQQRFVLNPDMENTNYIVQKESPTWIHFSNDQEPQAFSVRILFPPERYNVFHAKSLFYSHQQNSAETDKPSEKSMGSLSFEVDVESQKGEHEFELFFYAPPAQARKEPKWSPQLEMQYLMEVEDKPLQLRQVTAIESPDV